MSDYKALKVTGPISLERVDGDVPTLVVHITILLGLTGVGKSNFLECLHGDNSLKISGDSLESVTQEVVCYKLVNVFVGKIGRPMYILDCPGFSDNHLSEMAVVKKLQAWSASKSGKPLFDSVFYFHRISDKRLSGSQRRTLNLVKTLVGEPGGYLWVGIVTTMWDTLWREDQLRSAEERFEQLKEEHLKNAFGHNADQAFQFHNSQESAMRILDEGMLLIKEKFRIKSLWGPDFPAPPLRTHTGQTFREGPFALPLYQLLLERISGLELTIRNIDDSLVEETSQENPELLERLIADKTSAEGLLICLQKELIEFGEPPEPPAPPAPVVPRLSMRDRLTNLISGNKGS